MEARNESQKESADRTLVITRIFNAPRALVWQAWTEPEHMKKWWGPKAFSAPTIKIDLRVGGKYLWCMLGEDGKEYWTTGVYQEIVPPQKLVYTDNFSDPSGNVVKPSYYGMTGDWAPENIVTVTFEEVDGKTKMTLQHTGIPAGEMMDGANVGWNESFDKLEQSLKQNSL